MTRAGSFRYAAELLSLLACAVLVAVVAAAAWLSYRGHSESEHELALRRAENMALVLRALAGDTLRSVDDAVRGIKGAVERSGINVDLAKISDDYRAIADYIAVISVADAEGRLVRSTLPIPGGAKITDLAHFRAHVGEDSGEPFINRPVLGRVSGKWSFHVTRRINRPGGAFGGVAVVAVDLSYWERLLREGHIGESGAVALVGLDGFARAVFAPGARGQGEMMNADFGFLAARAAAAGDAGGRVTVAGNGGGLDGTWVYRRVEGFPLLVAVAADDRTTLARLGAMRDRYVGGALAIILLIVLFTLALLIFFSRQRLHATERARMAESWRQSEERFRSVFDQAAVGMGLWTIGRRDQPWLRVNRRLAEFLGYPERELLQVPRSAANVPEDEALAADMDRRLLSGEITTYSGERQYLRKDGSRIWGHITVNVLRYPDGRPAQALSVVQDINDRKLAEAALHESESRFRTIFEHAGIGITLRHAKDRYRPWLAVNDKFCEMTGYSRGELLRMSTGQITLAEENAEVDANNARIASGEITSHAREKRIIRKDGSLYWVALVITALPDAEGRPYRVIAAYQDINARKIAEGLARESDERFRAVFDRAGVGMSLRPARDRLLPWTAVNDKFCEMTGYSREELLRLSTADLTPPEGHDEAIHDNQRLMRGEVASYAREKRLLCRDERLLWVNLSVASLPGPDGRPQQIVSTYQDITARKQVEELLRKSEQQFKAIFDHAGIGITLRPAGDRSHPWLAVNDKFCEMTGYSREEALRLGTIDITAPERTEGALRDKKRLLSGETRSYTVEKRIRRKDGSWIWIALSVAALPDAQGNADMVIATYQDINARRLTEERLRAIIAAEPECVAIVSPEGMLIDMNPAGLRMLEAGSLEEMRERPFLKQVVPQFRRAFVRLQRRILAGGSGMLEFEAEGLAGRRRWLEIHGAPLHDASGAITALLGIARDVTERRTAREALAAERNLLRTVIDSMPDRIRVKDQNLRYMLANKAWMALRAPGAADVKGLGNHDILPLAEAEKVEAEDLAVLQTGHPSLPREVSHVSPDGLRWYITTKTPLRGADGAIIGVISISRDVTDLKLRSVEVEKLNAVLEARVAERTQQLTTANEELEAFASSVSHDLRAPLRQIDGFAAALAEDYADRLDAIGGGYLSRIRAAVSRMGLLIEDLLRLSRVTRAELRLARVDLSGMATAIAAEMQRENPQRKVDFRIQAGLCVEADPGLLQAALANLLSNAWKFTGSRESAVIEFGAGEEGGETVYFVRDNGAGFDMAHADRLFGTFQRLHHDSEFPGTGIGLAIVRRIIRRHGGEIRAESAPGAGATFRFSLGNRPPPAVARPPAVRLAAEPPAAEYRPRGRRLLLVDDDPDVLLLAQHALQPDGYDIVTATSGEAAAEILDGGRFDAVISDFSMPGMNGVELLSIAAKRQPHTLRVIVTGQALNEVIGAGMARGEIHHYFQKQANHLPLRTCIRNGLAGSA
ncbi:MAG: PAS domain S-box protein [Burkholderiales bacterium]|nr:PAS domain S-box protein [Burkholderiales bacterium]